METKKFRKATVLTFEDTTEFVEQANLMELLRDIQIVLCRLDETVKTEIFFTDDELYSILSIVVSAWRRHKAKEETPNLYGFSISEVACEERTSAKDFRLRNPLKC